MTSQTIHTTVARDVSTALDAPGVLLTAEVPEPARSVTLSLTDANSCLGSSVQPHARTATDSRCPHMHAFPREGMDRAQLVPLDHADAAGFGCQGGQSYSRAGQPLPGTATGERAGGPRPGDGTRRDCGTRTGRSKC